MLAPGSRLIIHIPVIYSDLNILRSVFTFVEVDFLVFRHKFASYVLNVRLYCLYAQLEFDIGHKISGQLRTKVSTVPVSVVPYQMEL